MSNYLLIKTNDVYLKDKYRNVSVGLNAIYLYCPEDLVISANSISQTIDLKISLGLYDRRVITPNKGSFRDKHRRCFTIVSTENMNLNTPLRSSIKLIYSTYRDNIQIVVDNLSSEDYNIIKGDILVILAQFNEEPIECIVTDDLESIDVTGAGFI